MKESLELQAIIDGRIGHKTKNIDTSLKFMHENIEQLDKKTALMGKDIEYMKKSVSNIETKMDGFIASADKKFSTKGEHQLNSKRIDYLVKILIGMGVGAIMAIIYGLIDLLSK